MKKFLKFLFVTILIVAIAVFGYDGYSNIHNSKTISGAEYRSENYMPGISEEEIAQAEAFTESLKDIPSEIEGMSMYDKQQMGLMLCDGDSDADGLTDKEEIEIYGTDPTKKSTAGDFYSDGYKVSNGLNPLAVCELTGTVEYPNVFVDNVTPIANNLDEACVFVNGYESVISNSTASGIVGHDVYQILDVSHMIPLRVDVSEILSRNEVDIDDLTVFNCESVQFYNNDDVYRHEKAEFAVDGNNLIIQPSEELAAYNIVIANDSSNLISEFLGNVAYSKLTDAEEAARKAELDKTGFGFATCKVPVISMISIRLGGSPITVYYYDTGNTEINNKVINELVDASAYRNLALSRRKSSKRDSCYKLIKLSYEEVFKELEKRREIFPDMELCGTGAQNHKQFLIYYYETSEDLKKRDQVEPEPKEKEPNFNMDEEIFPFGNFVSTNSDGKKINGHCAAIATITAQVHNGTYVPMMGSWTSTAAGPNTATAYYGTKAYDISNAKFASSLQDYGLNDVFDSMLVDSKGNFTYSNTDTMAFNDMCDVYLEKYNNLIRKYTISCVSEGGVSDKYAYYNVQYMKDQIDRGKIMAVGFLDNKMGHVVNAYDYYEVGDTVFFNIYDNNHPNCRDLVLKINPCPENDYLMDYTYISPDHVWTSNTKEAGSYSKLIVTDENMHFITDTDSIVELPGDEQKMVYSYRVSNQNMDEFLEEWDK